VPAWRRFLAQFTDVLVILLLVAASISAGLWLYERDSALPYEAMAIFAIVILNALMGHVQQARAENALAALRQMLAAHATVIRAGARQSIRATELVPGDVILVEGGDTVPADARLVVVPDEAETVRAIFRSYLELGSVGALVEDLDRSGVRTKCRVLSSGAVVGGGRFGTIPELSFAFRRRTSKPSSSTHCAAMRMLLAHHRPVQKLAAT
jgi:hypothetical protein